MERYLEPGEYLQLETRPHEAALALPLARSLAIAILGAVLVVLGSPLFWGIGAAGAVALAVAAFLALAEVLRWDRTRVVLTTEKLFVVHGTLRRRAAAVRLGRVPTIEVDEPLVGRLLGYGTLVAGDLEIPYVPRPRELARLLG